MDDLSFYKIFLTTVWRNDYWGRGTMEIETSEQVTVVIHMENVDGFNLGGSSRGDKR